MDIQPKNSSNGEATFGAAVSKETIAWIIGIVLVLGGGVWYLLAHQGGSPGGETATTTDAWMATSTENTGATSGSTTHKPTSSTNPAPGSPTAGPGAKFSGVGTLNTLVGLKENYACTINTISGPSRVGTLYLDYGVMRADLKSVISGTTVPTSMANDGKYLYVWANGSTHGLKLLAASSVSGSAVAAAGGIDPGATINYDCNPATTDASFFEVPGNITFTDTSGN